MGDKKYRFVNRVVTELEVDLDDFNLNRARIEHCNQKIKIFSSMTTKWRHEEDQHSICIKFIGNIINFNNEHYRKVQNLE